MPTPLLLLLVLSYISGSFSTVASLSAAIHICPAATRAAHSILKRVATRAVDVRAVGKCLPFQALDRREFTTQSQNPKAFDAVDKDASSTVSLQELLAVGSLFKPAGDNGGLSSHFPSLNADNWCFSFASWNHFNQPTDLSITNQNHVEELHDPPSAAEEPVPFALTETAPLEVRITGNARSEESWELSEVDGQLWEDLVTHLQWSSLRLNEGAEELR